MSDLLRDAPIGQVIRFLTNNKVLQYPEEKAGFTFPATYFNQKSFSSDVTPLESSESSANEKDIEDDASSIHHGLSDAKTRPDLPEPSLTPAGTMDRNLSRILTRPELQKATTLADVEQAYEDAARQETIKALPSQPIAPQKTSDGKILVDWWTTDDQENPQNWSRSKKGLVVLQIYLYTFAVYIASAIYTPSIEYVVEQFHIAPSVASLGLSMYVLGYGWGPMIFSPLSEIPAIGRNPPYMVTFAIYLVLSIGTAVVNNFPALVVLRFLQGFFGSPALATGGASIGDLYSLIDLPYFLTGWAAFATAGPALGPLISGFSVPKTNWHWSLWEVVWLAAPVFISMMFLLPETSSQNILLRRARRLRKIQSNTNLVSQSEIDQASLSPSHILIENLWRPVQINALDPAILFTSVYIGLLYGIFYSFFESFPLVYGHGLPGSSLLRGYGMNLGEQGLIFLSISVGVIISITIYLAYLHFIFNPSLFDKSTGALILGEPERRLTPGLYSSFIAPVGLFIFAWTGFNAPEIHWIVPTIGVMLFTIAVFILFQVIFIYIALTYPQYAASLFAGNDVVRSSVAAGAIHFASPLFKNLGVGRGVSLLGGLTFIGVIGIWALYFYGSWLRSRSRFAAK